MVVLTADVFQFFIKSSYGAVRRVCLFIFYGAARCGFFFLNPTVRCGAVLLEVISYGAVQCGCCAVLLEANRTVRCGAVRFNRTAPHRTVKSLEITKHELYRHDNMRHKKKKKKKKRHVIEHTFFLQKQRRGVSFSTHHGTL